MPPPYINRSMEPVIQKVYFTDVGTLCHLAGLKDPSHAIKTFQRDLGDAARPGYVVHPGDVRLPLRAGVTALPFGEL